MSQVEDAKEEETCTHDSFTVWIVETRKQFYSRNEYTGKLEETSSRAWESDWSTITCECGDCGKSLDKDDIDKAYEIKDWKPKESVWKIRFGVTRVTNEVHYAFGHSIGDARKNVAKGESHQVADYPVHSIKPKFKIKSAALFEERDKSGSEPEKEIVVETSCPTVEEIRVSRVYKKDVVGELIKHYPTARYNTEFKWHTTKFGEKFLNLYITDWSTNERVDHWKFAFVKINGVIENV